MVTVKTVSNRQWDFLCTFSDGSTKRIPKPTQFCADGWMERGQAKTASEAEQLALAWAGYPQEESQ